MQLKLKIFTGLVLATTVYIFVMLEMTDMFYCQSTQKLKIFGLTSCPEVIAKPEDISLNQIQIDNVKMEFMQIYNNLREIHNFTSMPECDSQPSLPCRLSTCTATIPQDPLEEFEKVMLSQRPIPDQYYEAIAQMKKKVTGWYDLVFLTGSSSNHFDESQGLVRSLHLHTFPLLQAEGKSSLFIYYDLGLSSMQRKQLEAQCGCIVLDFPFQKFPDFMRSLRCYTWKPIIIHSHHQMSPVTYWFDAATRLHNASLDPWVHHVMKKGIATAVVEINLAAYTAPPMLKYFGDQACRFAPYPQFQAGILGFRNSPWVRHGFLQPWLACAFSPQCMCPGGKWRTTAGLYPTTKGTFGRAHRYDQAALGVLLSKMFRERSYDFHPPQPADFLRNDIVHYFTPIKA